MCNKTDVPSRPLGPLVLWWNQFLRNRSQFGETTSPVLCVKGKLRHVITVATVTPLFQEFLANSTSPRYISYVMLTGQGNKY